MEHAQSVTTRAVSADMANYKQQLADADKELELLRAQLMEAEGLVTALQAAKLHAAALDCDDGGLGAEPQDVSVLQERAAAQEAELQVYSLRPSYKSCFSYGQSLYGPLGVGYTGSGETPPGFQGSVELRRIPRQWGHVTRQLYCCSVHFYITVESAATGPAVRALILS